MLEPLYLPFFQLGLFAAVLTMIAGSGMGFTIVMRREAYLGHGVGQAMIAGVAIGAFFDLPAAVSALTGSLVSAALIAALGRLRGLTSDTAIAMVSSCAFALGVAIISSDRERGINVSNVLFGNVLGVTKLDVAVLAAAALMSWIFALATTRKLALSAGAPRVAVAHGVYIKRAEIARTIVLAGITAASVQIVGVTLVVVALTLPAAAASFVARTISGIHTVSLVLAVMIGAVGMYISYWYDIASGPAIVLTAGVAFVAALIAGAVADKKS